ncbi:hypothetical protein SAMN04489724_3926 [Algoriphagus locisalis]|uniref:Addiction module component n=1 Tax=Algoriphagus locisalis TaxID=305507 RepID=A0A1I7DDI3_9BACT|nr:hypothetical protein [Algoriphagus locisalis]SFU09748.1 hypothetical protein SAMN04489724_3926 [Algoriphagus locisalis]
MKKEKLRSDIYSMIADVESEEWLEEIKLFLANRADYEARLNSSAQVSEEDIKYGRVMDIEEIKRRMSNKLNK